MIKHPWPGDVLFCGEVQYLFYNKQYITVDNTHALLYTVYRTEDEGMRIIINNSSMQPIYEQFVEQIKAMILNGTLKEEAPLPSVRKMSSDLRVSALTIKKAYDTLEQEAFVITVHGKGSFIAHTNTNILQEECRKELESKLEEAIRLGRNSGIEDKDIKDLFNLLMEES